MRENSFLIQAFLCRYWCEMCTVTLCSELAGAYNWPLIRCIVFLSNLTDVNWVWHRMKHRRRRRSLLITIPCSLLLFGLVVTCSYISNRFSGNSTSDTFFLQDGERIFHYQQNNFVSKFCVSVLNTLNFASCKMLWHLYRKLKYSLELIYIADWSFG